MHMHFTLVTSCFAFTSPIKLMTCLPDKHQPHQPVSQRKSDAPGSRTNACCTKVEEGCRTAGSPLCRLSLLAVPETLFCRLEKVFWSIINICSSMIKIISYYNSSLLDLLSMFPGGVHSTTFLDTGVRIAAITRSLGHHDVPFYNRVAEIQNNILLPVVIGTKLKHSSKVNYSIFKDNSLLHSKHGQKLWNGFYGINK